MRGAQVPTHYDLLGAAPDATDEGLRRAYRELVVRLHPDLSGGLRAAEERFRLLAGAFDVLSDPRRRAAYDATLIVPGGARQVLAGALDGVRGALRPTPTELAPRRGRDHSVRLRLAFGVAMLGGPRHVELPRPVPCPDCEGRGGAEHPSPLPCHACRAAGEVRAGRVGGQRPRTCPLCGGRGVLYPRLCAACDGVGTTLRREVWELGLLPGSESGRRLRLRGRGFAGIRGGPNGDLLVHVEVEPHPLLRREGQDVHVDLPLSVTEAALGAEVTVPTLEGPAVVRVPAGAAAGRTLRLRERGVPDGRGHRGDLLLRLTIEPPEAPEAGVRAALLALEASATPATYPARTRFRAAVDADRREAPGGSP